MNNRLWNLWNKILLLNQYNLGIVTMTTNGEDEQIDGHNGNKWILSLVQQTEITR